MATATTITNASNACLKNQKPYEDPITREDVEVVVKRALGSTYKLVNYYLKSLSEEKIGFMGNHGYLTTTVQKDGINEKEVHTFFLKSIPYENDEQAALIDESSAFRKEAGFFEYIAPELLTSVKDKCWIPKCYLIKNGILLFENLSVKNYALKSQLLDVAALKSALTSLAKLHASSILAEKRMGKKFIELYPELLKETLFVRDGKFGKMFGFSIGTAVAIAKKLNLDHTRVEKICWRICDKLVATKTGQNVICHADSWSNNLMFDNSEPIPKCALVDFQWVRYAPLNADVVQLLYLTTRRKYREKHEKELLRHYYQVLCDTLNENQKDVGVLSFDELLQEYEEMRLVGIVTAALYYQIILMDGKVIAEMTKDSDGFENLFFHGRENVVLKLMDKDSKYNERITEIITEMVERSEQFF